MRWLGPVIFLLFAGLLGGAIALSFSMHGDAKACEARGGYFIQAYGQGHVCTKLEVIK